MQEVHSESLSQSGTVIWTSQGRVPNEPVRGNPHVSGSANGLAPYADGMKGSFLGPRDSDKAIEDFLILKGVKYQKYNRDELPKQLQIFLHREE
jgi:hypothetical protein